MQFVFVLFVCLFVCFGFSYFSPDIDECVESNVSPSSSSEICRNPIGSYECICKPGYELDQQGTCQGIIAISVILSSSISNIFVILYKRDKKLL